MSDLMRKAFETSASAAGYNINHLWTTDPQKRLDDYADMNTTAAWWGWQAALAAPTVSAEAGKEQPNLAMPNAWPRLAVPQAPSEAGQEVPIVAHVPGIKASHPSANAARVITPGTSPSRYRCWAG